eukprot:1158651-Pelagomonas_calceolata.AAC.11
MKTCQEVLCVPEAITQLCAQRLLFALSVASNVFTTICSVWIVNLMSNIIRVACSPVVCTVNHEQMSSIFRVARTEWLAGVKHTKKGATPTQNAIWIFNALNPKLNFWAETL